MKDNKSIKILLILCIAYILVRLPILFTSSYLFDGEEIRMGVVAKEIMGGSKLSIWDYQALYSHHQGGVIINSLLIIPLFYIFGDGFISTKLLWLLTSLGTLIILYCFLNKFFNRKVAILTSLLFILSPPFFTIRTLTDAAVYNGAVFFTVLIMYLFYNIFFNNKPKFRNFALFGFICGFALSFELSSLVMIFTCLLFWFIFDKKFFLKAGFFIFIVFFLVGFSPSLFYNFTHDFRGYDKLYPGNFFQNAQDKNFILASGSKLFNLLTRDLPDSFFERDSYFGDNFHFIFYGYYLIFIISFIYIVYLNRKNILKFITGLIPHNRFNIKPSKFRKEVFILAYPVIFALIYSISVYSLGMGDQHMAYRYILPTYPFIFIIISLFIVSLFNNKNKIFRYVGILIATMVIIMGVISNINLIAFDNWNPGDTSEYKSYYSSVFYEYRGEMLGQFFGSPFVHDILPGISACNNSPMEFRDQCFKGLGRGIGNHGNHPDEDISSGISACNKVPIEFRGNCFRGLGKGMCRDGHRLDEDKDISSIISACNKVPSEFRGNCFRGVGESNSLSFVKNISSGISACNKFPTEFKGDCFNGLSETVIECFGGDVSVCNKVPIEFRDNCFSKGYKPRNTK